MNFKTPSEFFNLPIIGKIYCQLPIKEFSHQTDEFDVIQILEVNNQKIYVCNSWNSPEKPQLVSEICVLNFISNNKISQSNT